MKHWDLTPNRVGTKKKHKRRSTGRACPICGVRKPHNEFELVHRSRRKMCKKCWAQRSAARAKKQTARYTFTARDFMPKRLPLQWLFNGQTIKTYDILGEHIVIDGPQWMIGKSVTALSPRPVCVQGCEALHAGASKAA